MPSRFDCIKELSISGLRSFGHHAILRPGVPNGKPNSGLTILVGPNGRGKSAILEALHLASRGGPTKIPKVLKNDFTDHVAEFIITWTDDSKLHLKSDDDNPDTVKQISHPQQRPSPPTPAWYVGADRYVPNSVGASENRATLAKKMPLAHTRERGTSIIASRMRQWRQPAFTEMLARVTSEQIRHSFDGKEAYVRVASKEHEPTGLGYGVCSVCYSIDALFDAPEGSLVLIDEPELSLHPKYQRSLLELLEEKSSSLQIIITTHSPYFVNWHGILEGAKLYRVYKDESLHSQIRWPSDDILIRLAGLLNDVNNPHVLGLDSREVFFLRDRVILVEGQEDVICYKKAAGKLGVNLDADFFGWGVGGAPKMAVVARLLQDLGYNRVVGILDGNMKTELHALREQFRFYNFVAISAENIRDKKRGEQIVINGLCDTGCNVYPKHVDELRKLLEEVRGFLDTDI